MRNQPDPKTYRVMEHSQPESATPVPGNKGDALSCIVFMVDGVARDNNASVHLETIHEEGCHLISLVDHKSVNNETINEHEATSEPARQHLYLCDCDATVEVAFTKKNGDSLLVCFRVNEIKITHPWLDDEKETRKVLESDVNSPHPLLEAMKLIFKERMGSKISATDKVMKQKSFTTTIQ